MDFTKFSKNQTGLIFFSIYLFVITLGFVVFVAGIALNWQPLLSMLLADVIMTIAVFLMGLLIKNASLYDPYWSVIPPFIIIEWNLVVGTSSSILNTLVLLVVVIWSVRLTYNWWKNWTGFQEQDWRYDMLKDKSPKLYPLTNFFGIHLIPTLVVFIQLINVYDSVSLSVNVLFIIGLIICLAAPIIQFIADKQMYEFRQSNKNKAKVIDNGLWRYSRHPNYFGELLFWTGIYIIYVSSSNRIDLNIIYPIAMILLFVFISVPMMEKKLENRKGYSEYKNRVSMIIPFRRKHD